MNDSIAVDALNENIELWAERAAKVKVFIEKNDGD